MPGKKKCRILREIRQKIADENDIPLVTEECRYKGDCKGTCPRCESELRYLEQQLEKRRALGKKVTVSALALGLVSSLTGCAPTSHIPEGDVPYSATEQQLGGAADPANSLTTDAATDAGSTTEEEFFPLEGDVTCVPETEYAPEDNANAPVYGPPETEAPETEAPATKVPETKAPSTRYDPGKNVEANVYGPPQMMESIANDG